MRNSRIRQSGVRTAFAAAALMAPWALFAGTARALPIPLIPCGATGQLAQDIKTLNTAGVPGQIYLTVNCTYAITAALDPEAQTGLPDITGNITIVGSGDTIERAAVARFRLLHVARGGTLTLSGVTLTRGLVRGSRGGGVLDEGRLNLTNSTLDGDTAAIGGGLFVAAGAAAAISGSVIEHNIATLSGGGIASYGVTNVSNTEIVGNTALDKGGGIASGSRARINLADVSISGNVAETGGGGIANSGGNITVSGGQITENNTASGPAAIIQSSGSISITKTTIRGNAPSDCIGGPTVIPDCTT